MGSAGASAVRIETTVGAVRTKRKQAGDFPPDVLLLIFARLPTASLALCSTVCAAWHDTIENSPFLWEKAFVEGRKEIMLWSKIHEYDLPKKAECEIRGDPEPTEMDFKTRGASDWQRAHLVQGLMVPCFWQAHKRRVDSCRMRMETIVSGSADQTVRVWSASTLRCLEEYKVSEPKSSKVLKSPVVDLDFDENKIIGAVGAEVWVWNRNRGGRVTHKMRGHSNPLYCLCYTGPEVAVGCADGCTRIYDMYSGRCSRIFRTSNLYNCLSGWNKDTPYVELELSFGKPSYFATLPMSNVLMLVRFYFSSSSIVTSLCYLTCSVDWRSVGAVLAGPFLCTLKIGPEELKVVRFYQESFRGFNWLMWGAYRLNPCCHKEYRLRLAEVCVRETPTQGKYISRIEHLRGLPTSPSLLKILYWRNHSEAVTCVSIHEETDLLASGSRDGSLQLCDLSSGTNVARLLFEFPFAEVNCLQMGMNGRFLFAGTSAGGLICWDLRKPRVLWRSNAMMRGLTSLHLQEYAPATFITGSANGGVQVWDSSSGEMLREHKPASICRSGTNPGTTMSPIENGSRLVNRLNTNLSNLILPRKQSVILCARVSTTRVLTSHVDGSIALCTFRT